MMRHLLFAVATVLALQAGASALAAVATPFTDLATQTNGALVPSLLGISGSGAFATTGSGSYGNLAITGSMRIAQSAAGNPPLIFSASGAVATIPRAGAIEFTGTDHGFFQIRYDGLAIGNSGSAPAAGSILSIGNSAFRVGATGDTTILGKLAVGQLPSTYACEVNGEIFSNSRIIISNATAGMVSVASFYNGTSSAIGNGSAFGFLQKDAGGNYQGTSAVGGIMVNTGTGTWAGDLLLKASSGAKASFEVARVSGGGLFVGGSTLATSTGNIAAGYAQINGPLTVSGAVSCASSSTINGPFAPLVLASSSAANNTIFVASESGVLAYKGSDGVTHPLH